MLVQIRVRSPAHTLEGHTEEKHHCETNTQGLGGQIPFCTKQTPKKIERLNFFLFLIPSRRAQPCLNKETQSNLSISECSRLSVCLSVSWCFRLFRPGVVPLDFDLAADVSQRPSWRPVLANYNTLSYRVFFFRASPTNHKQILMINSLHSFAAPGSARQPTTACDLAPVTISNRGLTGRGGGRCSHPPAKCVCVSLFDTHTHTHRTLDAHTHAATINT